MTMTLGVSEITCITLDRLARVHSPDHPVHICHSRCPLARCFHESLSPLPPGHFLSACRDDRPLLGSVLSATRGPAADDTPLCRPSWQRQRRRDHLVMVARRLGGRYRDRPDCPMDSLRLAW